MFGRDKPEKCCEEPGRSYRDYGLALGWAKDNGNWRLDQQSMKLQRKGKEIGVTLTELYNDWDD